MPRRVCPVHRALDKDPGRAAWNAGTPLTLVRNRACSLAEAEDARLAARERKRARRSSPPKTFVKCATLGQHLGWTTLAGAADASPTERRGGTMKFVLFVIALDARSGQRVWRYNLGAGVNGRQYVAVAAGGNFQLTYPCGDVVAIFK